jgi:20S proteasome alpha/beta subunit
MKPHPKAKRLPKPKRMTICIGMTARDGIVIAADAQETDQYYKRSQQKILTFVGDVSSGENASPPKMGCAFTGAGEAGYLDAFFAYALEGLNTDATQADFKTFLANKVHTFHKKYLFPLSVSPSPPEISILVGAYVQYQTCLFVSHGATLRRAVPYVAVGAGAHFALSLMDNLGDIHDLRHTELLAAYVIGLTKERIEGCGNYTAIVSLHGPTFVDSPEGSRLVPPSRPLSFLPYRKIQKWEEEFGARWASRQEKLLQELVEEELADDLRLEHATDLAPSPQDQTQS